MRAAPLELKARLSQTAEDSRLIKKLDKILYLQIFLVIILFFCKVYVRCLYISEEKRIAELKYKVKSEQGNLGKLKTEHARYTDRERLDALSKTLNKEENIVVYMVK